MQAPIQAPPQPRYFMQLIVGRDWNPSFEKGINAEFPARARKAGSRRAGSKVRNPCLLRLTTFAWRGASGGRS
jgi:hypothetical protein